MNGKDPIPTLLLMMLLILAASWYWMVNEEPKVEKPAHTVEVGEAWKFYVDPKARACWMEKDGQFAALGDSACSKLRNMIAPSDDNN